MNHVSTDSGKAIESISTNKIFTSYRYWLADQFEQEVIGNNLFEIDCKQFQIVSQPSYFVPSTFLKVRRIWELTVAFISMT